MKTKPRTCPHCGYQYSVKDYFKSVFFKPIWEKWECDQCGTEIKFSLPRRLTVAFFQALVLLLLFVFRDTLHYGFYFMIAVILISYPTLSLFEKFKVSDGIH